MAMTRFISFFLVLMCASTYVVGQVTVAPGTDHTLSQDPATGGTSGDNGNFTFSLFSNYDLNTKTLKASAGILTASIGTGSASSELFYDFQVGSTAATAGHTVGGWINYVVTWSGNQAILAVGASNASVEVDMVLRDITGSKNLHFEPIHDLDLQTYRVKVVVAGINFSDAGVKPNTFPAVLVRGHTYRLTLRLSASMFLVTFPASGSFGESNYAVDGIKLNSLNVKAGLDEREVGDRLTNVETRLTGVENRVTGVENRLTAVEHRLTQLENHRHIYLTGRGAGQNNTEAQSSLPILGPPPAGEVSSPPIMPDSEPATKPAEKPKP